MHVPYINLGAQHVHLHDELMAEISKVISTGQFILGDALNTLERTLAKEIGVKYALGVANGTDALMLSMKALGIGPGDEVITAPNSFLASASSIVLVGAKPVFADVCEDMNIDPAEIRKVITKNTKAIMPVHLTGKPANMDEIMKIAKEFGLYVIEDAAQAYGASVNGKKVGSIGTFGCFSLHPLKNISACGDGGIISYNDDKFHDYLIKARNHGLRNRDECDFFSLNSRLDNLQAAILNVKMKHISDWNARRRDIAAKYTNGFGEYVVAPVMLENEYAIFHTYIIQTEMRDELMTYLKERNIETKVHYPIPIHKQKAFMDIAGKEIVYARTEMQSKQILSFPIYPELTDYQVDYVIQTVRQFYLQTK